VRYNSGTIFACSTSTLAMVCSEQHEVPIGLVISFGNRLLQLSLQEDQATSS
ncbi:hypothetical protein A2U01_0049024, partial [Trifolium medium]|nr:hypothetical protein [Trifolium medium]